MRGRACGGLVGSHSLQSNGLGAKGGKAVGASLAHCTELQTLKCV